MGLPGIRSAAVVACLSPLLLGPMAADAAGVDVVVRVSGIAASQGEVGCALFGAGPSFPMDAGAARQVWVPAEASGVLCRFVDVPEGRWAVSVSHDLNGNHKVDTNLFGLPTEAWGVSNNVRPMLRPPRFEESAFNVASGQAVELSIRVAK